MKLSSIDQRNLNKRSLPSRERGLKPPPHARPGGLSGSLPSRERGLKPDHYKFTGSVTQVAPFTGAWIETSHRLAGGIAHLVAPFTGAWIETFHSPCRLAAGRRSLPSRERGLKRACGGGSRRGPTSLPSRERGLKREYQHYRPESGKVAPFTGAWIETPRLSRPRSRGWRRSLHGSVD